MSTNQAIMVSNVPEGHGFKPKCKHCDWIVPDGEIGEVKNYPDDGGVALFFKHVCAASGTDELRAYAEYSES